MQPCPICPHWIYIGARLNQTTAVCRTKRVPSPNGVVALPTTTSSSAYGGAETCIQAAKTRLGHATTRPTTGENLTVRVYLWYTAVVPLHGIHMASCKPTFMLYRRRPDTFLAVAPPNAEIGRDRSVKSPENVPISSSGTACRCVCRACKVAQRPHVHRSPDLPEFLHPVGFWKTRSDPSTGPQPRGKTALFSDVPGRKSASAQN